MKIETLELLINNIKENKIKDIDKMDIDSLIDMDDELSDFILASDDEKRLSLYRVANTYQKRDFPIASTLEIMNFLEQQDNEFFIDELIYFFVDTDVLNSQGLGYIISMAKYLSELYEKNKSIAQIRLNINTLMNGTLIKERSINEIISLLELANSGYTSNDESQYCRLRCLLSVVKNKNLLNICNGFEHRNILGIISSHLRLNNVERAVDAINSSDKLEYSVLKEKVLNTLTTDIDTNDVADLEILLGMLKDGDINSFTTKTDFIKRDNSEKDYVNIKGRSKKSND